MSTLWAAPFRQRRTQEYGSTTDKILNIRWFCMIYRQILKRGISKNLRVLAIIMVTIFPLLSCGQRHVIEPTEGPGLTLGYLSGDWDVYHIWFTNVVSDTTSLTIFHVETHVCFVESTDTISTGTVVDDTIRCTDMYGLGISKIFIDDADHMHSELPMCESSNGMRLVRQSD